jgi:pseudouridine synthase
VISTTSDPQGRQTVVDLVSLPRSRRSEPVRLYPVGRLDAESEGLILLTNDGALTERLTHPRYEHPRIYRVLVEGEPDEATLDRWRRGITLDGRPTRFDKVYVEEQKHGSTWLRITVHEGRKHLVRRVVAALGHPPKRLIRVAMGPLQLGDLPTGKWRYLTSEEVERLRREMGTRRRSRRGGAGRKKPSQPSRREAGKSGGRSSPRSRRRSQ